MKNYLFVDGTNLYASQYELFGPQRYLNFSKFIKEVEKKIKVKFNKIYFYASYSPKPKRLNKKQALYLKNEGLFYKSVRETENVSFFKGYRSKTSGKEKEVDVKLAVDIVSFAHLNKFKNLYLFSGDADFMHALKIAEQLKKGIFVLATENRIPNRFTYIYRTIIFSFYRGIRILPKQRIKVVMFSREKLLKKV